MMQCVLLVRNLIIKNDFKQRPLEGQVALITGSRLKIGYQATWMVLRAGAMIVKTAKKKVEVKKKTAVKKK